MKKVLFSIVASLLLIGQAQAQLAKDNKCKFLGNITTRGQIQPNVGGLKYETLWDQLTCENESKWGTIVNCTVSSAEEGVKKWNWNSSDAHYKWCKQNGVLFKFHCLVWTSQFPSCLKGVTGSKLKEQVGYWMDAVAIKYPDLAVIDVVNEAIKGHAESESGAMDLKNALSQALGNSSNPYDYKWIAEAFRMARERFPNAVLIYNDYNTFTWQKNDFVDLVSSLVKQGAPIDAYGHQSHDLDDYYKNNQISNFGNTLKEIHNSITQKAGKELQCYITEFDISQGDENTYETIMKNTFKPMWEADFVSGITIWGFVNGATWRDNTGLVTSSGSDRSGMKWLKQYMASDDAKNAKAKFCGKSAGGPSLIVSASETTIELGQSVTISAEMEGASQITYSVGGTQIGTGSKVEWTPNESGEFKVEVSTTTSEGKFTSSVTIKVVEVGPYGGKAAVIPGKIEAENYDNGFAGKAFNDLSDGNTCDDFNNFYRSDDVDIKELKDGAVAIGHCQKGEWMNYTVNVVEDGDYDVILRAGTGNSDGGKLTLSVGNTSKEISIDKTGSWGTFDEIKIGTMKLSKGEQVLKLAIDKDWIDIDWISFDKKSGVSDYANNNVITIIPNPASSKIKIFGAGDDVKAEFVSLAGSIVKVSDKSEISLDDVACGVYMLRITTPNETVVKKLVVKK
ncbi:MAG: carbohydrate-binding protein [Bacteroidales bacterium]|jgi:GH35 family endo-1,4-beta-xylanase|nr:carbohydrate-binding protein [Bacteroidales bacterium]